MKHVHETENKTKDNFLIALTGFAGLALLVLMAVLKPVKPEPMFPVGTCAVSTEDNARWQAVVFETKPDIKRTALIFLNNHTALDFDDQLLEKLFRPVPCREVLSIVIRGGK